MHIELIDTIKNNPITKAKWNDLVQGNITNTIFQTYEWINCWWNNYGSENKLTLLIAYNKSEIIGIAPLMLRTDSFNKKTLRFIGDMNADYCDFIINGNRYEIINAFMSFIYSQNIKWCSIHLLNIPSYSTTKSCLQTISYKNKHNIQIKKPTLTPTLIVENKSHSVLKSINKYSIKRHVRKLEKIGYVEFNSTSNEEYILERIQVFFNQHIERYKLKDIRSQFTESKSREFYIDLVKSLSKNKWIIFSTLTLDNKEIAFHYGFNYNNKIIWYKPSFDVNYKSLSPGTVLLIKLIEHTVELNCTELDFTIGDEPFKKRFANSLRYNENIIIYKSKIVFVIFVIRQLFVKIINYISSCFGAKK